MHCIYCKLSIVHSSNVILFIFKQFKRFTHQHTRDTGRTIQQVIEESEANIQWMDRNYKTFVEWLGNVKYENS